MKRLVLRGGRVHGKRLLRDRRHRVKKWTHGSIQRGVVRAPQQIANTNAAKIYRVICEA